MRLFIDCETTGLNPSKNSLISIGIGNSETGFTEFKMKPELYKSIEDIALEVNGYSLEEIWSWPDRQQTLEDFESYLADLSEISKDMFTAIGQNYTFDLGFILPAFPQYSNFFTRRYLDTMIIGNFFKECEGFKEKTGIDIKSCSLKGLCEAMGIEYENSHTAIGDAMLTEKVYNRFKELAT